MTEVAIRLVVDPNPNELREILRYEMLQIFLPDGKWYPPKSGIGYVKIQWREGTGHSIKSCEVRGPALLRGIIKDPTGDRLPDDIAMRAAAIAIHDYYRQITQEALWSFPR